MRDDIKKRREKYENITTDAQKVFGKSEMILERKAGMDIAAYKYMRGLQSKTIKRLFRSAPDHEISRKMIPGRPNQWLELEVAKHKALKTGQIEEVVKERFTLSNFFPRLFNYFRKIMANNHGQSVSKTISPAF